LHRYGISVLESIISSPMSLEEVMRGNKELLKKKAGELIRLILVSMSLRGV